MLEAPLGGAGYNNEYGRPALTGYFRTFEQLFEGEVRGYHKPIVIAGGLGNIRPPHVSKGKVLNGTKLIVLGGPAMLIGLGGGAGSSMTIGTSKEELDFASVQRDNAEIQRRTQEVIDQCWALGSANPIASIHDVGAGGLSNAFPELADNAGRGAKFELRHVPNAEPGMSPMEIWSNEAQERYVLAIPVNRLKQFEQICARERCPFAVVGEATSQRQLLINDKYFNTQPVDIPMDLLFGKPPRMLRQFESKVTTIKPAKFKLNLRQAVERVLKLPAVASKGFLIAIGDRTVGGQVARDQMVGPWQVPVADVAVTIAGFETYRGEAMAMGERTPLGLTNAPASARMAVGEAITNIAAADIGKLSNIKLSANWMAAAGHGAEDQNLFETVKSIGLDFCPALGISIPVGKDSLSMRTVWDEAGKPKSVTAPLSVIITAFASVADVRRTKTAQLQLDKGATELILIDLGRDRNRLGGSALAQVYNQLGGDTPDVETSQLKQFFTAIQRLKRQGMILAYHDRSDGGLFVTICEMAFASHCGLDVKLAGPPSETLFSEELGAVIQVKSSNRAKVLKDLQQAGLIAKAIGKPTTSDKLKFTCNGKLVLQGSRVRYQRWWAETSYRLQALRDNSKTAKQEFDKILDTKDPGLNAKLTFKPRRKAYRQRPKVAVLREQGVNGQIEMAAAFDRAGFEAVDVHMSDVINGRQKLDKFGGLAACGGFSYGDVLGAGSGWAKSILFNQRARDQFETFFNREDTFSLGVCNGCQMLAQLKSLIPGTEHWPIFNRNLSDRFEARVALVQINKTRSLFLEGMSGSVLPIPTAHGEGYAQFNTRADIKRVLGQQLVVAQFVDNYHRVTEAYPANVNGSPHGIAGLTSIDGRATIMMPHPERVFRTVQNSWYPQGWGEDGPWLQLFRNARKWVG